MTQPSIDPTRCPLCQGDNACAAASGAGTCWCFSLRIPEDVLARVPAELRDVACICERCASGRRSAVEAQGHVDRLIPDQIIAPYGLHALHGTHAQPALAVGQECARVLVVEDEPKVANALKEGLEGEGYYVVIESSGEGAFRRATMETFDAILLDLGLAPELKLEAPSEAAPMRDGLDVLRTLRGRKVDTPVLILTARDALDQRVLGLDSGADDYLVKPFAFEEMLARLRALLRRPPIPETLRFELLDLTIDLVAREVTRADQRIELTLKEFELLAYLARHAGQVVSRDTLARDVWKESARFTSLDNVIDVHVARIRKKIDMNHPMKLIHTVRGVGFTLGSEA